MEIGATIKIEGDGKRGEGRLELLPKLKEMERGERRGKRRERKEERREERREIRAIVSIKDHGQRREGRGEREERGMEAWRDGGMKR